MTADQPVKRSKSLTDEELARLLDENLDPVERTALVERLDDDPDAVRVLALAASEIPSTTEGLSEGTIDRLLKTVKEKGGEQDICPHCAGDLHPGGMYCPHCTAQVVGNPVTCIKCGKPVREGSVYCPHCGSFFRPIERSSIIESRLFLLVFGLVSIAIAIVVATFSTPAFIIFLAIGCISLGALFGEMQTRWKRSASIHAKAETESDDERKTDRKKTG